MISVPSLCSLTVWNDKCIDTWMVELMGCHNDSFIVNGGLDVVSIIASNACIIWLSVGTFVSCWRRTSVHFFYERWDCSFKWVMFKHILVIDIPENHSWNCTQWGESHRISLISQCWFRQWLGVRQQAVICTSVDRICMAPLGVYESVNISKIIHLF